MNARSPWRTLLYKKLETVALTGEVIDLGGSRKSAYIKMFKGDFNLTVADMVTDSPEDIVVDLERPLPIESSTYDHVLCINLLEHIYNYQAVVNESYRILKADGQILLAVPFLIQVHPSPHDHWRFTKETLEKIFTEAGFADVSVETIGTGVFGAIAQMRFNMLHFAILRKINTTTSRFLDGLASRLVKKNTYSKEYYPLGYIVTAKK